MPASRSRLLIVLLTGAMIVEFAHRMVFAMLMEPIRIELDLSDSQMGSFLTVFAAAYAPLAILLGGLADRHGRRWILAGCIAGWSAAGGACGAAGGYASLFVLRALVGVGQSGNGAIGQALIADALPPERRAGAIGIVTMGGMLGGLVGLLLGGVANEFWGWRATLGAFGLGGVAFGIALAVLLPEPAPHGDARAARGFAQSARELWALRTYRHLTLGATLSATGAMSIAQWTPTFVQRVHGLDSAQAGGALAAISLFGAAGTLGAGIGANRLWQRDPRFSTWIAMGGVLAAFPLYALAFSVDSVALALVLLAAPTATSMSFAATATAATQAIAPIDSRARAAGIQASLMTLVGMGAGPSITGLISDALEPRFGPDSLSVALTLIAGSFAWAALHFALASRSLRDELLPGEALDSRSRG